LVAFDSDSTAPIQNLILRSDQRDAPDVALPASPVSESPYTTQIKEFQRALRDGTAARVNALDGLAAVQIATAAIQSVRSGKAVQLETLQEVKA
jgi:predicted dehydrogenase